MSLLGYTAASMLSGAGAAGQVALLQQQKDDAELNKAQLITQMQTQGQLAVGAQSITGMKAAAEAAPALAGQTTTAQGQATAGLQATHAQLIANTQAPLDQATQLAKINAALPAGTAPYVSLDAAAQDGKTPPPLTSDESVNNFIQAGMKTGSLSTDTAFSRVSAQQIAQFKMEAMKENYDVRINVQELRNEGLALALQEKGSASGAAEAQAAFAMKTTNLLQMGNIANATIAEEQTAWNNRTKDATAGAPTPAEVAEHQRILTNATQARDTAVNGAKALMGVPVTAPAPATAKTGWDSSTGEVWNNGKVIGNAKSAPDASAMIHAPAPTTATPTNTPAPSPVSTPATPPYTPPAGSPAAKAAAARTGAADATASVAAATAAQATNAQSNFDFDNGHLSAANLVSKYDGSKDYQFLTTTQKAALYKARNK